MLVEAVLKPKTSRKPLGILAILGTLAAIAASVYQLSLPAGTAFFGTVQSDAFSVFFHLVIGGIVLVTLLISLDYFEGHTSYVGEYYALIMFGATGMMLMTCSVELADGVHQPGDFVHLHLHSRWISQAQCDQF